MTLKTNKNIWLLYFTIFFLALAAFCFYSWKDWKGVEGKYASQQLTNVHQFGNAVSSLFGAQEMMLKIVEERFAFIHSVHNHYNKSDWEAPLEELQVFIDNLVQYNPDIAYIAISTPEGRVTMTSSNTSPSAIPNLLVNPDTLKTFHLTLFSGRMVIGRTYKSDAVGQYIIPLRKAFRDENENVVAVFSLTLKINNARLLNDSSHIGQSHSLALIRDDGFRQFVSSFNPNNIDYDTPPKVARSATSLPELVVNEFLDLSPLNPVLSQPFILDSSRYSNDSQVALLYIPEYGLWVSSRILMSHIVAEFLNAWYAQLFLFILVNVLLFVFALNIARSQIEKQKSWEYQAHYDDLTGLLNRRYLRLYLSERVKDPNASFFMLYVDVDNFKMVNDTYGHNHGDYVLREISSRLKQLVATNTILVREAGDEFIIVTTETDHAIVNTLASNIIVKLCESFMLNDQEFMLGSSIGIAKYPDHGHDIPTLMRSADIAMYNAKKTRNSVITFDGELLKPYMERLELEQRLRQTTENDGFFMVYQPQLDNDYNLYGVEALIRWNDVKFGFVPPDKFIPIAESSGLMFDIGQFVIETTLREISSLQRKLDLSFQIAINISAKQFYKADFASSLMEAIHRNSLAPTTITIEITESIFIENLESVLPILITLRKSGIKISLDDFGTGYSSLSMLRALPIDELKIDKSFTDTLILNDKSHNLIQNIISIGKSLDLSLLAEGIEHLEQQEMLSEFGCDQYQGYYFARPMKLKDLKTYISNTILKQNDTDSDGNLAL
jgi:diguanylate cyclase (GGDEF)-like protein